MWARKARRTDQKDLQGCSTVRLTLPVGDERTGWNVQGRVAVLRTLPLGGERTVLERSGPSGSATGTLGGEWQCVSHCHSGVSVPGSAPYTATRCRAYRVGTLGAEWQCVSHCHSGVSVPGRAPYTATRCRAYRVGTLGGEWQCVSHCHSGVSVPDSAPYTATRCRAYRTGTLGGEWQCDRNAGTALLVSGEVSLFGFALPRAGAARHAPDAQSHSHSVRQLRARTRERYQDPPTH